MSSSSSPVAVQGALEEPDAGEHDAGADRRGLFLLSVVVFKEPLQLPRLIGFALIWGALAVYSLEGLFNSRRVRMA